MKAILQKFIKDDKGEASIIEMTLIFPLVLFVMLFLIFMGVYVLQSVHIYNYAQKIAVAAAREAAMPGYEYLYESYGITTTADFNIPSGKVPNLDLIKKIMSKHEPYRYCGNNFLDSEEKASLEAHLKKLVEKQSFLAATEVDCTITTTNNILSQQVHARVVKRIAVPKVVQAVGLSDIVTIDVTATAVVSDPAEFVRNTDMVFDLTEYLMDNLKIGAENQTINEKIAIYKQKMSDVCAKIGINLPW